MSWALKGEKLSDRLINGRRLGERPPLCSPEISLSSQGHQNFPKDPNDPEGDVSPSGPSSWATRSGETERSQLLVSPRGQGRLGPQ